MAWIEVIEPKDATGELKRLYDYYTLAGNHTYSIQEFVQDLLSNLFKHTGLLIFHLRLRLKGENLLDRLIQKTVGIAIERGFSKEIV